MESKTPPLRAKRKIKIGGKSGLSDAEIDPIAAERKKQGEAAKSAQELYISAVEERS